MSPGLFGIPIATLALAVASLALGLSAINTVVGVLNWRRDRADIRVGMDHAQVEQHGRTAGPLLGIRASNRGRRPVTLTAYGLAFSNGTNGFCPPYPVTPLPVTISEGQSYQGFIALRRAQENVRANPARLTAVYFDAADGRRFRFAIARWSKWHKQLRTGELAPPVTNEDLLGPFGGLSVLGQQTG